MQPNVSAVRALLDDAKPVPSIKRFSGDPEPGEKLNGMIPGQWTPHPQTGLPPDCPVIPLGVDGKKNWYLDTIGQLQVYEKPYAKADTIDLFRGRDKYLKWAWPKWKRDSSKESGFAVETWDNDAARDVLIAAATVQGPWSVAERVRGRGCWASDGGSLVVHLGTEIVAGGRSMPPGMLGRYVYPTRPPIPDPLSREIAYTAPNPAARLTDLFATWSWNRPGIDPHLLLGWIGCALLGPALPWRSAVYLTGDKGSGKSTLQNIVKGLLGEWLIATTNTTAAGIYQHVGQDGIAVAIDEFEGKANNDAALKILDLARQSSSGSGGLRGGDKGTGTEFCIRSAFLFSSINAPPMEPADLTRFALLQLARLRRDQAPPVLQGAELAQLGRQILRRLIDQWPRFQETWAAFRAELARGGLDARGQDTFGTLLACADMIGHDQWDEERLRFAVDGDLKPWSELLAAAGLAELEDATENWRGSLTHLLQVPVDAWRNGRNAGRITVGQVLLAWYRAEDYDNDVKRIRDVLAHAGLGLKRTRGETDWLIVPNQSPLVHEMFKGTKWAGIPGAGIWSRALRQGPRGEIWEAGQERVAGVVSRCTLIRMDGLYGDGGIMTVEGDPGRQEPLPMDE